MAIQKSNIKLQVNQKPVDAYLCAPEGGGPGILLLHAWWGFKPFFGQVCERLAAQGFTILAPDLNDGQVAATIDEAKAMMEKRDNDWTGEIVMAAKDALLARPERKDGKIGVIGFSMGAAWALVVASQAPEPVAATVLFYGAYDAGFDKMKSAVQGHFSPDDEWEPLEGVQTMEKALKMHGVQVETHIYPGTKHWFVEEDRPEYNAEAAQLAWQRTFDFFKKNLSK